MDKIRFVLTRLWRYLGLYFLKPFDAVNDTLAASLLHRLDWTGNIVEIGSGDGVFSYIMHGGTFFFDYDRYLMTDLSKKDIYNSHRDGVLKPNRMINYPRVIHAIDAKAFHIQKVLEIGYAQSSSVAAYEKLPFKDESLEKIFYYIPHGLKDLNAAFSESWRVLVPGGRMLILLYDISFKQAFLSYRFADRYKMTWLGSYFKRIDNGRFQELINLAMSIDGWAKFFREKGFVIRKKHSGLSHTAWRFYDIQTRPFLNKLISIFNIVPHALRSVLKLIWMLAWYPVLIIFYLFFSNDIFVTYDNNCFFAFEIQKLDL